MMDPLWLLILLPVAALSGWVAATVSRFQWRSRNRVPKAYMQGINYLLNEQRENALDNFYESFDADNENYDLLFPIGNLYRQKGEIGKATRIHQLLVERTDLTGEQRSEAFYELGFDYYSAGILDKAEQVFKELLQNPRFREKSHNLLREIYEQEREWDQCISITKKLNRFSSEDYMPVLAQYYCELAEEAIRTGNYNKAENYVQTALDTEVDCVRAILQSGRIRAIRGEHQSAIEIWKTIETINPKYISETAGLVLESYKALNQSHKAADFLKKVAETEQNSQFAIIHVDILQSLNKEKEAEKFLLNWIRKHKSFDCLNRLVLLKLKSSTSIKRSDIELIEEMIINQTNPTRHYKCQRCGYDVKVLHWQCPSCRVWDQFEIQQSSQHSLVD